MFEIQGQKITKNNVLTSYNFARIADVVYAEAIPDEDYSKLQTKHTFKIKSTNGYTLYKTIRFTLYENCVVFCHLDLIHGLFEHLQDINEFNNITLITSQSDNSVTKKLYNQKPKCISQWFSTNVEYQHSKVTPIPLGIANLRNTKNIIFEDYLNTDLRKLKKNKVFANFNLNTNYFHRFYALKKFFENDLLVLSKPTQTYEEYLNSLVESKYTLSPWGNGVDTHRIWESIYAGSIPITKSHTTFSYFSNLPIILLDSYDDFKIENIKSINFDNMNYEMLTISWWERIIRPSQNIDLSKPKLFKESQKKNQENISFYHNKIKRENLSKSAYTIFRKLHKKILGKKINEFISV